MTLASTVRIQLITGTTVSTDDGDLARMVRGLVLLVFFDDHQVINIINVTFTKITELNHALEIPVDFDWAQMDFFGYLGQIGYTIIDDDLDVIAIALGQAVDGNAKINHDNPAAGDEDPPLGK